MGTVSVVTVAALVAYILAGLFALARVPDPSGSTRRLVALAYWPAVAVRTASWPSRRRAHRVPAGVACSAAEALEPPAAATVPPVSPGPAPATPPRVAEAAAPTSPLADAAPALPPPDARSEWERFVRRLTELSD